jgi:hypothetical protein
MEILVFNKQTKKKDIPFEERLMMTGNYEYISRNDHLCVDTAHGL